MIICGEKKSRTFWQLVLAPHGAAAPK